MNLIKSILALYLLTRFAYGDFVEKVYRNDRMDLVSALVNDEALTKEDLEEIKALIEKTESER